MSESPLFTKKVQYRDFDIRFVKNPRTGDIVTLSTEDSIKQSVKLLVMTSFYERPRQPLLGSRIRASLFEFADSETRRTIKEEIFNVLKKYEPRVNVSSVVVDDSSQTIDNNTLNVLVVYQIVGTTTNINQSISLKRIR